MFEVVHSFGITYNGAPLDRLNEIEFVDGFIYANRYYDTKIYKISLATEEVVKVYDMSSLVQKEIEVDSTFLTRIEHGDVLNGIAYDKSRNLFLLTGKRWNHYYEVELK